MLYRNMGRLASGVLTLTMASMLFATAAQAGNKKMMTVNAAKVVAQRAIVESVVGLKVRSTESVQDMVAAHVSVDAKTTAAIKGIEFVDILYDPAKDIAKVTAQLAVGRVSNIIGRRIDYGNTVIQRVGFGTSTPAMAGPLKALRAAEIDAYKELAKKIVGFTLDSNTSVENYLLKSDTVATRMMAAIYGAEITGYHWDEQGDAYVKLSLKTHLVEDILSQRLNYQGELIEVEGMGAQVDDFSEAQRMTPTGAPATGIREGSIDVPVAVPARPGSDGGGATDLLRYQ